MLLLLWLWNRLAAAAPIQPLAQEFPYAAVVALKRKKFHWDFDRDFDDSHCSLINVVEKSQKKVVKDTEVVEISLITRSFYNFSHPLHKIKLSQQKIMQVSTFVLVCLFQRSRQIV